MHHPLLQNIYAKFAPRSIELSAKLIVETLPRTAFAPRLFLREPPKSMRLKTPVTFRATMPKKSAAGHGRKRSLDNQEEQSPPAKVSKTAAEEEWRPSKCGERDLLRLVVECLLQKKDVVQWCPTGADKAPWELTGDIVVFAPFVDLIHELGCLAKQILACLLPQFSPSDS